MSNSNKANDRSMTGSNTLSTTGDIAKATNDIIDNVGVSVTEVDVKVMNNEIGLAKFTRPAAKLYLVLATAVSYLMVRRN